MRLFKYRDIVPQRQKAVLLIALFLVAGCHGETADQALDRALRETNKTRDATAKFAGKVTIDGQRPELEKGQSLVVILYDPQKPPPNRQTMPRTARCRPDGNFAFNTYGTDDWSAGWKLHCPVCDPETFQNRLPGSGRAEKPVQRS